MKYFIVGCILIFVAVIAIIFICNYLIVNKAKGKLYNSITDIPFQNVGILLGTSKYQFFGPVNPYYKYRIDAAIELLKNNKIKYIIVSGDSNKNNFNEPEQMKIDLIKEGIDPAIIFQDFAGNRTYDSMYRLLKIFDKTNVTVISQEFHNQRALYIADRFGISAIGFNAKDVSRKAAYQTLIREKLARVKVFVDFLIGLKPRISDIKIIITKN